MLEDKQIKLIIESLDTEFEKEEKKYKTTKQAIQELCNHNELVDKFGGRECSVCGKIFPHTYKLTKYIKKEVD